MNTKIKLSITVAITLIASIATAAMILAMSIDIYNGNALMTIVHAISSTILMTVSGYLGANVLEIIENI